MGNHSLRVASDTLAFGLMAEQLEAQLRAAEETALQCQTKERELRAMQRGLTAQMGNVLTLHDHLKAQWQSTAYEAEDNVSHQQEQEIDALRRELEDARQGRDRMEVAFLEQKRACEHAVREREDMAVLLSQRTSELGVIQDLLPRSQSTTDSDVVELVANLNYEISQAAIALADSLDNIVKQPLSSIALESTAASFEKLYGKGVTELFLKPLLEPELQLQLGLQGILTHHARSYVHRWSFANSYLDFGLQRLEEMLDKREPEHISDYWKSLGRKYARISDGESSSPANLAGSLARHWSDALWAIGYRLSEDRSSAESVILLRAGKQLEEVSKAILELNTVVGETVTSGRMRCCLADYGAPFDADKMVAYFEDKTESGVGARSRHSILCAIKLGLQREERGTQEVLLIKPKVIIELAR